MRMNVAVSLNQKYFYYTYVMLTSLYENNREAEVHTYVLHQDLEEESLVAFKELACSYGGEIHELKIDVSRFSDKLPVYVQWTVEMYFRLMLVEILPKEVSRILYLDVDMIVNKSLTDLYRIDFGDKLLAACRDKTVEQLANIKNRQIYDKRRQIFPPESTKECAYFNSGMILFNIEQMRNRYSFDDYMKAAEELNYDFSAPDQDILNYVHWKEVLLVNENIYNKFARIALNEGWNYEAMSDTCIIHYAGHKPWNADNIHFDIELFWWEYAKKTPYYHQLCNEFIEKSMKDTSVMDYVKELLRENGELKENLNKSIDMNNKLIEMVNRLSK
ncbi:MAG: glycosyltransferase family 8 protein [Alistipes sp.]|nr:glycosyltransferase family 8 protein [Alistipes sp.]